jgi:hypothetical protein
LRQVSTNGQRIIEHNPTLLRDTRCESVEDPHPV